MTQPELEKHLLIELKNKYNYKNITYKEGFYILAEGTIPICLVAHTDTVFKYQPINIFYDSSEGVMWSPEGLGADDRAGILAILTLLEKGHRPHIIFTNLEESGMIGADELIQDFPRSPIKINFIIQLDRRGKDDCVFYECDNIRFIKYIQTFGFSLNYGTCSDISIIAPEWGIAATNVSVGYEDEHSYVERLYIKDLMQTIFKVDEILTANKKKSQKYKYIPKPYRSFNNWMKPRSSSTVNYCEYCYKPIVLGVSGNLYSTVNENGEEYEQCICDSCIQAKFSV